MTTRAEHLQWCKDRAHAYIDRGDLSNVFASMMMDLGLHEGTKPAMEVAGMLMMTLDFTSKQSLRKFINGFN